MVPYNKYTLIFKQETVDEEVNIKNIEEPLIMSCTYDKFCDPNNKYLIFSLLAKEMSKYFDREICEKIFNEEMADELSELQK